MTHHHLSFCVAERERINNLNSIPCYFTICVYIFRVREGIVNKWIDNISIPLQIFFILSFFLTTRFSGKPKKRGQIHPISIPIGRPWRQLERHHPALPPLLVQTLLPFLLLVLPLLVRRLASRPSYLPPRAIRPACPLRCCL